MRVGVDTNVLARALIEDDSAPAQSAQARDAIAAAGTVYVPQAVQIELVWLLDSIYELPKQKIIEALEHLRQNHRYQLQSATLFSLALDAFVKGTADFADYLILAEAQQAGCELLSFDRKLLKSPGTRKVIAARTI